MGGGAGGEDNWVADDATRYVFFCLCFFTLLICTTTNEHSLHQIAPVFTPSAHFFTPPALSYPGYCPFLHQAPVFYPTCAQLPRLLFPRGPNDETLFRCLCPRLKTRLEPGVSFYLFYVLYDINCSFQDGIWPVFYPKQSIYAPTTHFSPTTHFQHSTARFHPFQHHKAHFQPQAAHLYTSCPFIAPTTHLLSPTAHFLSPTTHFYHQPSIFDIQLPISTLVSTI